MQNIQKIGGYLEIDKDGFIVKKASADKFQEKWKSAIEETKNVYMEHFGDKLYSVYIRGSVAKGEAIDGISDLDTIAIVNLPKEQIDIKWVEEFNKKIIAKYPFIKGVEIFIVIPERALDKDRGTRIILKTQSVCIYGKDISESIPEIRLGKESALHSRNLQNELQKTLDFFEQKNSSEEDRDKCSWIMKRIIRTGFELVAEREQKYTRDLYPCYESFSKYYYEKKDEMYKTLDLAINPIDDPRILVLILKDWLTWMPEKIEKVFGFKFNPTKIYFITGVCGTGKTTALSLLKNILPKDSYDLHDIDERGVPKNGGRQWRFEETKYLIGIGKANTEKGIVTIVSGFSRPSETKELAPEQKNISFILLDADDSMIEKRILGRYPTEESKAKFTDKHGKTVEQFVKENINFSGTMRVEAKEYGSSIIDTNNKSPDMVVEQIIAIIK